MPARTYGPLPSKPKPKPPVLEPMVPFLPEPEPVYMSVPGPPLDTMRAVSREWMFGKTPELPGEGPFQAHELDDYERS